MPQDARRTVLYFRVEDPEYPRNARIRAYLGSRGYEVILQRRAGGNKLGAMLADVRSLLGGVRRADAVVVSEMSLPYVPVVALITKIARVPLVVDGFVRKYETNIVDRERFAPWSMRAQVYRAIDALSVRLADFYLTDTEVRREAIEREHPGSRVFSLPVGAPAWARVTEPMPSGPLRVLFYGSYLPLHGTDTIIDALALCPSDVRLTMVGSADRAGGVPEAVARAAARGVSARVDFVPSVPPEELASFLTHHHVVLGLFGRSGKAASVIANKVWQGLAAGRVVVTRQSVALEEIRSLVADQLRTVPPGDASALADELVRLSENIPAASFLTAVDALENYVRERFGLFEEALRSAVNRVSDGARE